MTTRFYPVAPLLELKGISYPALVRMVGVAGRDYQVFRERGVTARVADRMAVVCGYHPAEVWPEWLADQEAADADRRRQLKLASNRRWAAKNRERLREANRAYYAVTCEVQRRDARRRYWADPERERAVRRARYARSKEAS